MSTIAAEVAYREGAAWLDGLIVYIQGNVDIIRNFIQNKIRKVSLIEPEGTFLTWLDFRELDLGAKALARFIAEEAQIALSPGYWYGREGAGFARMTIGCPRETVQLALNNLAVAIKRFNE